MDNYFLNLKSKKYLGSFRFISKEHCQGEMVSQENNSIQGVAFTEVTNDSTMPKTNLCIPTSFLPSRSFTFEEPHPQGSFLGQKIFLLSSENHIYSSFVLKNNSVKCLNSKTIQFSVKIVHSKSVPHCHRLMHSPPPLPDFSAGLFYSSVMLFPVFRMLQLKSVNFITHQYKC